MRSQVISCFVGTPQGKLALMGVSPLAPDGAQAPFLPERRFHKLPLDLGPGEGPAPDPHLPAVCPDLNRGKRCKEFRRLGFGEVVGDDAVSSPEGPVLRLDAFIGTHILDREIPEEYRASGPEHPADLGRYGYSARNAQVTDSVDEEDRIERPVAKRQEPSIADGEAGYRRVRVPPGKGDGVGRDVDRCHPPGQAGEGGEGLAVPATDLKDGGIDRENRERRRRSAPEVSTPPVIVIPGGCMIGHASNVGAAGG